MKKVYALYLPQYHRTEDNDKWWGVNYTEWDAVKAAKSLYAGHNQPNVPLNNNYYDLSDESGSVWKWQADLARQYGIDGFCIYHYWFKNSKQELQKPMEILLNYKEIDINYFVCWANEPWKKTWYGNNYEILVDQDYGGIDEWKAHFEYLKDFFNDKRYVKIDNKPVIAIYKTASIEMLSEMKKVWNSLARKIGYEGIYFIGAKTAFKQETRKNLIDEEYLFEPAYTLHYQYPMTTNVKRILLRLLKKTRNKVSRTKILEQKESMPDLYKNIRLPDSNEVKCAFGICPGWDNTPRKQEKGCAFDGGSPDLFQNNLHKMLEDTNGSDFIMINAWNEWGEGAYLEPDEKNGYAYLESIKKAKDTD